MLGWIWLDQVLAAEGAEGDFRQGKRHACRWFHEAELPRVAHWLALVQSGTGTVTDLRPEWL